MTTIAYHLAVIHSVRVLHEDWYPRNMALAVQGDKERLLWIDFDRASTLPLDRALTQREEQLFSAELEAVKSYILPVSITRSLETNEPTSYLFANLMVARG